MKYLKVLFEYVGISYLVMISIYHLVMHKSDRATQLSKLKMVTRTIPLMCILNGIFVAIIEFAFPDDDSA